MNAKVATAANEVLKGANNTIMQAYEQRMQHCFQNYEDVNDFTTCFKGVQENVEPLMKASGLKSQWFLNKYVTCVTSGSPGCIDELKESLDNISGGIVEQIGHS